MSKSDVSLLANESLTAGTFPAERRADFRVFIEGAVHAAIHAHASEDTSVEICGVLVGQWQQDGDGPFASVTQFIRCDNASQKMAEVTFTHESWSHINSEMDSKYSNLRIIGWYHSHPDFGIFLSDRDVFIQEHFFFGAGQVALVVDPVRKLEGLFEWRDGKTQLMSHYWVGSKIITEAAAKSDAPRPARERSSMEREAGPLSSHSSPEQLPGVGLNTLLAWLCLFLLGYLLANWSRAWEQQAIREGVVAHYGLYNLLGYGLRDGLLDARDLQNRTIEELQRLSKEHAALAPEEQREELSKRWDETLRTLGKAERVLSKVAKQSELTPEQTQLLTAIVASKIGELTGQTDSRFRPVFSEDATLPATNSKTEDKSTSNKPKAATKTGTKTEVDKPAPSKPSPSKDAGTSGSKLSTSPTTREKAAASGEQLGPESPKSKPRP